MEEQMTREEKIDNMMGMLEQRIKEKKELTILINDLSSDLSQAVSERNSLQVTIDWLFSEIESENIALYVDQLKKTNPQ